MSVIQVIFTSGVLFALCMLGLRFSFDFEQEEMASAKDYDGLNESYSFGQHAFLLVGNLALLTFIGSVIFWLLKLITG